jgi:6-phosphogluconolactonase (cycloisomerase 2 family)
MNLRETISTILLIAASALFGSCGFGSSNATHLVYVSTGQGVYGYRINNKSGASTQLPSAPFIVGNTPAGMVLDSSGLRGYLANQSDNTVSLLKIDSTSGVVSEVLPRTPAGGFSPNQLLLDSTGTTLFSENQLSDDISTFSVASDGSLKFQARTSALPGPPANMSFASGLLFVAVPNVSRVYVFAVSSGTLTPLTGSPLLVTEGVGTVTVDPSAKYLYVTNPSNNTIGGFSISSGTSSIAFTPITGSPFVPNTTSIPVAPITSILDATATHLYVANSGSSNLSLFSVGTNGALTSMSTPTVSVATNPRLLVFDPVSNYLLVGNIGGKSITQLSVTKTATLTSTSNTINLPSVPQAIAVAK